MSRGPGRWQRLVIEGLERRPAYYVVSLLPEKFTRAQYSALLRAVASLEERGRIEVDRYHCWATKPGRVVVRRPGARVSVDEIPESRFINIYGGGNE